MSIRHFPAAAIAIATLCGWVCFVADAGAKESTPAAALSALPSAPEAVQLSSGAQDILKLARAKVSDDVTVAYIKNGDRRFSLSASEILYLRAEGVSDRVLTAMLNQPSPITTSQTPEQPEVPSITAAASAPQFVATQAPATTTVVETAPVSTVYVASSAPIYPAFYDPWPY